ERAAQALLLDAELGLVGRMVDPGEEDRGGRLGGGGQTGGCRGGPARAPAVVVLDGEQRRRRAPQAGAGRATQGQVDRLAALGERVVDDGHAEGLGGVVVVGPGEVAGARRVVAGGGGGAVRGRVVDGGRPLVAAHPLHGDGDAGARLGDAVGGGAEA